MKLKERTRKLLKVLGKERTKDLLKAIACALAVWIAFVVIAGGIPIIVSSKYYLMTAKEQICRIWACLASTMIVGIAPALIIFFDSEFWEYRKYYSED